jgi:hypothetical protein
LSREDLRSVNIEKASKVVIFSNPHNESEGEENLADREAMYISLNVEKETTDHYKKETNNVLVMELLNDENMLFVDIATHMKLMKEKMKEEIINKEVVDGLMTPYFASGKAFSGAIFEMILSSACSNNIIIPLVKIFASAHQAEHHQNCHLALLPVFYQNFDNIENQDESDPIFYDYRNSTFEDLVSRR